MRLTVSSPPIIVVVAGALAVAVVGVGVTGFIGLVLLSASASRGWSVARESAGRVSPVDGERDSGHVTRLLRAVKAERRSDQIGAAGFGHASILGHGTRRNKGSADPGSGRARITAANSRIVVPCHERIRSAGTFARGGGPVGPRARGLP